MLTFSKHRYDKVLLGDCTTDNNLCINFQLLCQSKTIFRILKKVSEATGISQRRATNPVDEGVAMKPRKCSSGK